MKRLHLPLAIALAPGRCFSGKRPAVKRLHLPLAIALALGVCFSACVGVIDPFDPEVGEPLFARCSSVDSDPDVELSYARDIRPIFLGYTAAPGCSCHMPGAMDPIGLQQSGLNLSTYDSLRSGGVNSQTAIVVEGDPCNSVLWQKISPGPPFGSRMPFDGPPFLDDITRQTIADWIAEGARDN